jgi:hypothetical protein
MNTKLFLSMFIEAPQKYARTLITDPPNRPSQSPSEQQKHFIIIVLAMQRVQTSTNH